MTDSPSSTSLAPSDELLCSLGLMRSRHGYYEARDKPTREELEKFYRDLYYQSAAGSYSLQYDAEELAFVRGQNALRHRLMQSKGWLPEGPLSLLDVGCGEGFALKYFSDQGWKVEGVDFSVDGCQRMNPDCVQWLTQGDVFESLDRLIASGTTYDLVMLDNVLEHVIDPLALLQSLHRLVRPGGILVVDVPNDFSQLQMAALDKGWIDRAFWVSIPQHLAYFQAESLKALCAEAGWECGALLSDFPVDWYLANPNSNYIASAASGTGKGTGLGKGAHRARITLENLLRDRDMDALNELYAAFARNGAGRSLVGFFRRLSA